MSIILVVEKRNVNKNRFAKDDILKYYFTSSKISGDIKNNPDKYKADILMEFSDFNVIFWYEQLLIKESFEDPLNINGHYIDPNNNSNMLCGYIGMPGRKWTNEQKIEKSINYKGKSKSEEFCKKLSEHFNTNDGLIHKKKMEDGIRNRSKSGVSWSHKGKSWSQARREAQNRRKNNES